MSRRKNLIFSMLNVIISALQSVWLLSFIQRQMGVGLYGYVSVVTSIVNMANIVTLAFTTFTARYVTISLHRKDFEDANKYFNSAFFGLIGLACLCLSVFLVLVFNLGSWMNVEDKYISQVQLLFIFVAGSFISNAISTPMKAGVYYSDKIYIMHCLQIVSYISRIIFALVLYNNYEPKLWYAYSGSFLADFFILVIYFHLYKRLMPSIKISYQMCDLKHMKEILFSGVWVSINKTGATLLTTINTYLINIILTPFITGIYSTITQFISFVGMLTMSLISIMVPSIYKYYALEGKTSLNNYVSKCCKVIGIVTGFVAGGLIVYERFLLSLMIDPIYLDYSKLIILTAIAIPLTYEANVLEQMLISYNKFSVPAISQLLSGLLNVLMIFTANSLLGADIYTIVCSALIADIIRNFVFIPYYSKRVTGYKIRQYYQKVLVSIITCITTMIIGYSIRYIINPNSWIKLVIAVVMTSVIAFVFILIMIMDKQDKESLVALYTTKGRDKK